MALPKKQPPKPAYRINCFTGDPLNTEIEENEIVDVAEFTRYKLFNERSGDSVECFKVRGKNKEDYLVSLTFQNTLPYCNAIQYKRVQYPSLFLGELLIDSTGVINDDGYAWVPVVKEFVK